MEPPVTPTAVPYVGLSPDSLLEQTELPTERGYVPSPARSARRSRRASIDSLDPTALRRVRLSRARRASIAGEKKPMFLLPMSMVRRKRRCRFCRKVMRSRQARRWVLMCSGALLGLVILSVVLLLAHSSASSTAAGPPFTVSTVYGRVQGFSDGVALRFLGIPFAQAPVGRLRWAVPQPATPWHPRIMSGHDPGPACPQTQAWGFNITAWDEDCLFLSVYTPLDAPLNTSGAASANLRPLKPVVVFLHGGGFVSGASTEQLFDGSSLAASQGVVVVTVNYRLGALGFAAFPLLTQQDGSSGNYGLLDQQLALKFVSQTVSAFGGDPRQVTLWGQGAGGASALLHTSFQGSASLFTSVVSQSGPLDAFLPSLQTAYNTTGELVKAVCGSESGKKMSDEAIVRCMRGAHINSLVENSFAPSLRRQWSPVLDGIYLQGAADEALITGRVNRTVHQVMLGTTANDATAILYFMLQRQHSITLERSKALLQEWVPNRDTASKIWNRYSHTFVNESSADNLVALSQVVTDGAYHCRMYELAKLLAAANVATYVYKFVHHLSFAPAFFGASHFMALPFVWDVPCFIDCRYAKGSFNTFETALARNVQARFGHFFAGFPPSSEGDATGPPQPAWPLFQSNNTAGAGAGAGVYLNLGAASSEPAVTSFAAEDVCPFWGSLPTYPFGERLWLFD